MRVAHWRAVLFATNTVTPIQLAVYAAETKILMDGLAVLAAFFFAAALLFAFFFGTVNPRLRRTLRRNRRLLDEVAALRATNQAVRAELAASTGRVVALEKMSATFEKEIQRLDGIRRRTDSSLVETKALLARLQDAAPRVDVP